MDRIMDIEHKGKIIMYNDLSYCSPEEIMQAVAKSKELISHKQQGMVLTLTNVTGLHFNHENLQIFKEWVTFNKPYVKAAAIIGLTGMLKIGYMFVINVTKRAIKEFDNQEEAIDWLVSWDNIDSKNISAVN